MTRWAEKLFRGVALAALAGSGLLAWQVASAAEPAVSPDHAAAAPRQSAAMPEKPAATSAGSSKAAGESFPAEDLIFFEKQVRPLLAEHCFRCHNDKKQKGGLRLDSRELLLKGGDHGPSIDLAKPGESILARAIGYADEDLQMPPAGKLAPDQLATLTRWIERGAAWPAGDAPKVAAAEPAAAEESRDPDQNRDRWAYKQPTRPTPPTVRQANWVKTPIDAFVLARLEAKGLKPNPQADRVALIRRAYYDLLGLPPSPEEVDAFVADKDPAAWEKLVDRLLANPHYGEKWGRHWLDLVRYAETHGYERDNAKPEAYRYRDYVIRAFNDDKPYDQFLKEQLAGDELDQVTPESMIATGYYRLGIWDDEPADREAARYDVLDGVVSTTSSVVLGMSVGCARCHDHKKDPILQKDYYQLLAFFQDVTDMNVSNTRRIEGLADRAEAARQAQLRQKLQATLVREQVESEIDF